jgi:hypothetical protein
MPEKDACMKDEGGGAGRGFKNVYVPAIFRAASGGRDGGGGNEGEKDSGDLVVCGDSYGTHAGDAVKKKEGGEEEIAAARRPRSIGSLRYI